MTDKQKRAIWVLNEALHNKHLDEEEYMILLEFVVQSQRIEYVPCIQHTEPLNPYYYDWKTTCKNM